MQTKVRTKVRIFAFSFALAPEVQQTNGYARMDTLLFILETARRKGKVSHNNKKAADRQSRKAKQSSDKGRKTSRRSFKKSKKAFKKIKTKRKSDQIRTKKGGKGSSTRNISN